MSGGLPFFIVGKHSLWRGGALLVSDKRVVYGGEALCLEGGSIVDGGLRFNEAELGMHSGVHVRARQLFFSPLDYSRA